MDRQTIPIACTLEPSELPDRISAWRSLLAGATAHEALPDGAVRASFGDGVDIAELVRLAEAEQGCCAFFSFAITIDARGVALEVRAPSEATDLLHDLFGAVPS